MSNTNWAKSTTIFKIRGIKIRTTGNLQVEYYVLASLYLKFYFSYLDAKWDICCKVYLNLRKTQFYKKWRIDSYLIGQANATCLASGNWSSSQPTCVPIQCPPLFLEDPHLSLIELNTSSWGIWQLIAFYTSFTYLY